METDVLFTLGKRNSATLFNKDDKPIEHILAIKHALMPYGKKCSFPAGKKIRLFHNGIRHCFLLQSGEMSACRDSDGLKIANFREPSLAGIAETFFPKELIFAGNAGTGKPLAKLSAYTSLCHPSSEHPRQVIVRQRCLRSCLQSLADANE